MVQATETAEFMLEKAITALKKIADLTDVNADEAPEVAKKALGFIQEYAETFADQASN